MTFHFKPAKREGTSLLLALAGASGSGKTFSAMRLAKGMTPAGQRFAVIDTEAGRALHYADQFAFDHGDLHPPFRPETYVEAIRAADDAGYAAIVIDSMSHEWSGEGGILDWHESEMQRMAGDDWKRREAVKMAAWIKPKMAHKAMVQRLLQCRANVIFCLRAEEKTEIVKGDDGKTRIVPRGWQPICAKDFMFEMTASFILRPDAPGVPTPIKLQEQHRFAFPDGKPISEAQGLSLSAWAKGGGAAAKSQPQAPGQRAELPPPASPSNSEAADKAAAWAEKAKGEVAACLTCAELERWYVANEARRVKLLKVNRAAALELDKCISDRQGELLK